MKRLLYGLLLLISIRATATNYYFSSSDGDDARTASQAQNPSTPWKSLAKLNSFFANLQAGDSVLFKRGDIFYGSLTIGKSGSLGAPIVLGAYGSGSKPVLSGFTTVSGWTSFGSGIYESNAVFAQAPNVVTVNNTLTAMGRYPNKNASNGGYLPVSSFTSNSVTSSSLTSSPNWTGGEVVIRINRSVIDRNPITSHSGSTVAYTSPTGYAIESNGYGFFIQNHIGTLDQAGEWYFNPSTKKLYVYFGANGPTGYKVNAASVNTLVSASAKSALVFDNLRFEGANDKSFDISGGSNISITNSELYFQQNAVYVNNCPSFKLDNCVIASTNNNGVETVAASNYVVTNNTILNTGIFPGMGASDYGGYSGLGLRGDNGIAQHNKIDWSGYIGLGFYGGLNQLIKNNVVSNFCFVKDDGGGIYTHGAQTGASSGRKIQNNIVYNGLGAPAGTPFAPSDRYYRSTFGIYIDDNSHDIEISGNSVFSTERGIFLHNNYNIQVLNNIVYNNSDKQLDISHDAGGAQAVTNILNKRNTFFAKAATQYTAVYRTNSSSTSPVSNFGSFDSNFYCRPVSETTTISAGTTTNGPLGNDLLSLTQWTGSTTYSKKDPNSKKTPLQLSDTLKIRFEYNPTNASKTVALDKYYVGVDSTTYSGSVTLKPYSSIILLESSGTAATNTYYKDADQDGYGSTVDSVKALTVPTGYVSQSGDCNDSDATINPKAPEICDGKDNNCDGSIDEGLSPTTYYKDADGDGYGNKAISQSSCTPLSGFVTNNTDCNDSDATIHPQAPELCDGKDNNCDGSIDEGLSPTTYYKDADGDGYGNKAISQSSCTPLSGFVTNNTDCNDSDATIHPQAPELCDGKDNNCDGSIDEGLSPTTYYKDADGDGYGNKAISQSSCTPLSGFVTNNTDCNDSDATIHPQAPELCDGKDNNCDGSIDEGLTSVTYFKDADGDGYGDPATTINSCSKPAGYVTTNTDCNDNNKSINPGAVEICGNNVDDNCDGTIDEGCGSSSPNNPAPIVPSITISDTSAYAASGVATVTVYLSNTYSDPVSVNYTTVRGTARSNKHFVPAKGTLTIPAGAQSASISIKLLNSTSWTGSRYFYVQLSNAVNATIADNSATITILYGAQTLNTSALSLNQLKDSTIEVSDAFTIKAQPNPSATNFNLLIRSNKQEPISLQIVDLSGRIVATRIGISPNSTIQVGSDLLPGVYFAHALQGKEQATIKLLKLSQ